jgi:hypothetical protein
MSPHLLSALRLVHFLGMGLWFFAAMSAPGDVRKTLALGKPHTDQLVSRVGRAVSIGLIGGLLTIASGLAMIFAYGGFGQVRPTIHAGLSLSFVALALELAMLRPAITKLGESLASGDGRELRTLGGRIGMFVGIGHLLKLVVLLLMVFRF